MIRLSIIENIMWRVTPYKIGMIATARFISNISDEKSIGKIPITEMIVKRMENGIASLFIR